VRQAQRPEFDHRADKAGQRNGRKDLPGQVDTARLYFLFRLFIGDPRVGRHDACYA